VPTRRLDWQIEPMMLGNMSELGVRSLDVSCRNCHHQAVLLADHWPGAGGEPDRGAMAMLNDDETRSLEALARASDGCAEAALLADGFTIKQLSGLLIDGFATLERRRANVGCRERPVFWMQITEAGRKAIAA
jgi:hypothetical protein